MAFSLVKKPTLDDLARRYRTDKSSRGHNFANFYETYFEKIREKPIKILEIGLGRNCVSLRMWKKYFKNGVICGIDHDPKKRRYRFLGLNIFIGDQRDTEFLEKVMMEIGQVDIIVDDGSHNVSDQQISLGALFRYLKSGGYYIIEDLQTSFRPLEFEVLADGSNSTFHMLEEMRTSGTFQSQYLSEEQLDYVRKNIKSCELYSHVSEQLHSTSMIEKL